MSRYHILFLAIIITGAALPSCGPDGNPTDEKDCVPECRAGYVCDRIVGQCVSECNPPCGFMETCQAHECVPTGGTGGNAGEDAGTGGIGGSSTGGSAGTGGGVGGSSGDGGMAGTGGSTGGTGGTSTGGNAGEDAGTGGIGGSSTGGSGGTPACPTPGTTDACVECGYVECQAEHCACIFDPGCGPIMNCVMTDCPDNSPSCISGCIDQSPDGATLFAAVNSCRQTHCASCRETDAGTGGSTGGTGGTAGTGGSSGSGGTAGTGGVAGSGGTGGSTGGTGGTAGTGGTSSGGTGGNPGCTENATLPCYEGPAGTEGVGECKGGTMTCTGGTWGPCAGQVLPTSESCDFKDDDCDGAVDDGSLVVTAPKDLGVTSWVSHPAAALNKGGNLGIVWTRSQKGVWFALRDQSGNTVPPLPMAENQVAPGDTSPSAWAVDAMALNQNFYSDFWGAWSEYSYGSRKIQLSKITQDWGSPSTEPLGDDSPAHPMTAAKPGENQFGLVFENGTPPDIYFARHSTTYRIGGCRVSTNAGASTRPQVIWNGTVWVTVWNDTTTNAGGEWYAATVAEDGSGVIAGTSLGLGSGDMRVASGPNGETVMASAEGDAITVKRFGVGLQLLGSATIPSQSPREFAIVWTGTDYGLAWEHGSPGKVAFARLGPTLTIGATVEVTAASGDWGEPSVVWNGTNAWLVVLDEATSGKLYLAKVARNCP